MRISKPQIKCSNIIITELICLIIVQLGYSQCCLEFSNRVCIKCPDNMHLYRDNCLFNIQNCEKHDGFECIKCDRGYSLTIQKKCMYNSLTPKIEQIPINEQQNYQQFSLPKQYFLRTYPQQLSNSKIRKLTITTAADKKIYSIIFEVLNKYLYEFQYLIDLRTQFFTIISTQSSQLSEKQSNLRSLQGISFNEISFTQFSDDINFIKIIASIDQHLNNKINKASRISKVYSAQLGKIKYYKTIWQYRGFLYKVVIKVDNSEIYLIDDGELNEFQQQDYQTNNIITDQPRNNALQRDTGDYGFKEISILQFSDDLNSKSIIQFVSKQLGDSLKQSKIQKVFKSKINTITFYKIIWKTIEQFIESVIALENGQFSIARKMSSNSIDDKGNLINPLPLQINKNKNLQHTEIQSQNNALINRIQISPQKQSSDTYLLLSRRILLINERQSLKGAKIIKVFSVSTNVPNIITYQFIFDRNGQIVKYQTKINQNSYHIDIEKLKYTSQPS